MIIVDVVKERGIFWFSGGNYNGSVIIVVNVDGDEKEMGCFIYCFDLEGSAGELYLVRGRSIRWGGKDLQLATWSWWLIRSGGGGGGGGMYEQIISFGKYYYLSLPSNMGNGLNRARRPRQNGYRVNCITKRFEDFTGITTRTLPFTFINSPLNGICIWYMYLDKRPSLLHKACLTFLPLDSLLCMTYDDLKIPALNDPVNNRMICRCQAVQSLHLNFHLSTANPQLEILQKCKV